MATQTTSTVNDSILFRAVAGQHSLRCIDAATPAGYIAGNRFTIAHGAVDQVGNAVAPDIVIVQTLAADADAALSAPAHVQVVKWDSTNVTLRSDQAAAYHFNLYVG